MSPDSEYGGVSYNPVAWLAAAGLLGTAPLPLPTRRILAMEARDLAAAMDRALRAFAAGDPLPDEAVFTVNRALAARAWTHRLEADGPAVRLGHRLCPPIRNAPLVRAAAVARGRGPSALSLLAPLALDFARLLATADARRLRPCAAEGCGAWFLDTSKGGRRRWCSMSGCGNRAKAARHRRRRAVSARGPTTRHTAK